MSSDRPAPAPDWGVGRYEDTAVRLAPAAAQVVAAAAPRAGERVVDVGCGTGTAARLAAGAGAAVVGVDPAPRLLDVARELTAAEGLAAEFVAGDAGALPLGDAQADVALSSFGVIFAPDAQAAAAELARVLTPTGRIVLSAWLPEGAIAASMRVLRTAVADAMGTPPGPPPFAWHDADALTALLAPHGFEVTTEDHELAFVAESAAAQLDGDLANHPMGIGGARLLAAHGRLEEVRADALAALEAGNEDPDGFRVTSRYVVAVARR